MLFVCFMTMFYMANLRTNIVSPTYEEPINTIEDALRLSGSRPFTELVGLTREVSRLSENTERVLTAWRMHIDDCIDWI